MQKKSTYAMIEMPNQNHTRSFLHPLPLKIDDINRESEVFNIMHLQVNSTTKHTNKSSIELQSNTLSIPLSDYSEAMYPKGDEGGYVSVAIKNQREGWNQRVVLISTWTSEVQLDTNCYIS